MLFSSLTFIFLFLPVVLAVYYLAPLKIRNLLLLLASLIFYAWGELVYVVLMILSILLNYCCGREIAANAEDEKGSPGNDLCGGCESGSFVFL